MKKSRFPEGIVVPMITPFKGKSMDEVDTSAAATLTNYLIQNGVHGLMTHGTSGEFLMQTPEERAAITETVVNTTAGRVKVIAGISDASTKKVISHGKSAVSAGADAVIATGPIYYKTNDEGLYDHFQSIIDNVELPLMIYNIPKWIGYNVPPEVVRKLVDRNKDRIIGVKFTTTDLGPFIEYLRLLKDKISVMIGADQLVFTALELGAAGSVVGGANVIPREYSEIYDQFKQGNLERSKAFQLKIDGFTEAMKLGTYPAPLKEGLRYLGMECGNVRPPLVPLDPSQAEKLRKSLAWKKRK